MIIGRVTAEADVDSYIGDNRTMNVPHTLDKMERVLRARTSVEAATS